MVPDQFTAENATQNEDHPEDIRLAQKFRVKAYSLSQFFLCFTTFLPSLALSFSELIFDCKGQPLSKISNILRSVRSANKE
jgi:hypothetical protein